MAGTGGDPFEWDVDQVVLELCDAKDRPWLPRSTTKRPDPAALSAALRENDVDGETLLTYEDVMLSISGLLTILGLTKPAHQMTLVRAINYLKSKSPTYHQQKTDLAKQDLDSQNSIQEVTLNANRPASFQTLENLHTSPAQQDVRSSPPSKDVNISEESEKIHAAAIEPQEPCPPLSKSAAMGSQESPDLSMAVSNGSSDEPPQKKRRLAPVLVSTETIGVGYMPIPNAATGIATRDSKTQPRTAAVLSFNDNQTPGPARKTETEKPSWLDDTPGAYYGYDSLITADWVPPSNLVSSEGKPTEQDRSFYITTKALIPTGRRLQIHRAMRRLFRNNNEPLTQLSNGISPYVEPEDEDKILPIFGDSGTEDEYDSDTLREIEEEEEESQRWKKRKMRLTRADVDRVIDEEILRMEQSWEERKLPRKQKQAKSIWNQARRRGRIQLISQASSRLEAFNNRIKKLCIELQREEWCDDAQLRRQTRCLEASVEDRKTDKWLLDILRGPEPLGPEALPRPPKYTVQQEALSDEDGEIITSDDDDSGFITDSMEGATLSLKTNESRQTDAMDLDHSDRLVLHQPQSTLVTQDPLSGRVPAPTMAPDHVIDLTGFDSEPVSNKHVISLVTPTKASQVSIVQQSTEIEGESRHSFSDEELNIPFDQPMNIAAIPPQIWKDRNDRERLLISVLWKIEEGFRKKFFHVLGAAAPDSIWNDTVIPALAVSEAQKPVPELSYLVARLFRVFALCKAQLPRVSAFKKLSSGRAKRLSAQSAKFEDFCDFVNDSVAPHFTHDKDNSTFDAEKAKKEQTSSFEAESSERFTDDGIEDAPSKKRKRPIVLDQTAKDLRENDQQRLQEQEKRRIELRKKLAASDLIPSDKSRLIINESKQDDQGLIYVNIDIGKRIKEHQIKGVRFMWNQIICDPKVRQGCLLAHTMGLGKTMQVITLLVAIAEAAASADESVFSQVPLDLRQSKSLILCPSLLVDNWMDELLMWAPTGLLGHYYKLEAATKKEDRIPVIRRWDEEGGIMVIGYDMFKRLVDEPDEELPQENDAKTAWDILTQSPNIVVADEAHKLKNPESKVGLAAAQFKTQSRIALTGSPLANNVEEFYYMINWVAPHYLGPPSEFKELYAVPIQAGLYEDSTYHQFRKAKKQLSVLEKTVAPKAQRATIKSCLKNDLPPKMEFILTIPLTSLQAKLYDTYVDSARDELTGQASVRILATLSNLGLIVNHPRCWKKKLLDESKAAEGGKRLNNRTGSTLTVPSNVISRGLKMMGPRIDIQSADLSWKTRLLVAILDQSEKVGDKVLVFTQSIPTLDYLDSLLRQQKRKVARLDGSTPINVRQQHIKNFNTGDTQVYLISTTAGGVGLNIFGANRVIIFDFKYNPVHEQQAVGRAYRIGQQKPVYVYKFIAGGTFEAAMQNRTVFKTQLASRVVDKENPKRWSKKENEYLRNREDPVQRDLTQHLNKDTVLDGLLKNPELSQGIREIMMTNTFEEEDPDDVLTAEDRKDVDAQVHMNTLRHTNPEEFRRLEQERAVRLKGLDGPVSISDPKFGAVTGGAYYVHNQPPGLHGVSAEVLMQSSTQDSNTQPTIMGQLSRPLVAPVNPLQASVSSKLPGVMEHEACHDPQASLQPGLSLETSQVSQQRGVLPMPMAGANTFFRAHPEKVVPSDRGDAPPTFLHGANSTTKKTLKAPSSLITWPYQFEQKILEALRKLDDPDVLCTIKEDHNDLAKRVAQSAWQIRLDAKYGKIPDESHMKKLCSMMEKPRFAAAVVTGFLTPAELAHAPTFSGLDTMEDDLRKLDDDKFQERLRLGSQKAQDPNV
ncbi:snf2 family helicase [Colletotrichum truncatum]|uniref:Snf2 family helicase n=1 Tax=Colletotrichum truncatum TaxID=5467 RepID=A0ACC3YID8_COLTU|nr:snf2 family helicase [Colletotrichum truncatum]KAF6794491.1 snf2 family helicase [Colletotrichum truncatum]